ncbi:MAG: GNAT family N-acetyltransferase [Alphaproteobacteria bacterium]|nr:GNAT family N-acetyltransferase [Alphaproteobacteria bacterium]
MIKNTHDFKPIEGKYVNLREAEIEDAAFILSLRCDEKKARFLHKTENNLEKQIEYLKRYKTLDNEWYFIIENKQHTPLGTSRMYDVRGTQYTGGSWLMKDGSLPEETLEGAILARRMAFEELGFEKDCFDVRKANKKVVRFHKLWGSKIVSENEIDYFFEMTRDIFMQNKQRFLDLL